MITLDHESHIYYDGDRAIKSVSQILSEANQVDTRFYTEEGCERGSAVHDGTVAIDSGDLCAEDFNGTELYMYLIAYEKFLKDFTPKWEKIEEIVYCKNLDYGCTVDRVGTINDKPFTVDLKSGGPSFWHGLQLNAYDLAMNKVNSKRILFLKKNGSYSFSADHSGESFDGPMYRDYWISIAKKNLYDTRYLK